MSLNHIVTTSPSTGGPRGAVAPLLDTSYDKVRANELDVATIVVESITGPDPPAYLDVIGNVDVSGKLFVEEDVTVTNFVSTPLVKSDTIQPTLGPGGTVELNGDFVVSQAIGADSGVFDIGGIASIGPIETDSIITGLSLQLNATSNQIRLGEDEKKNVVITGPPGGPSAQRTITIPDPGTTSSNFILSQAVGSSATTQTINTGIEATSLAITGVPAGFDFITGAGGLIQTAYPSTMNILMSGATTQRLLVRSLPTGNTNLYTVPAAHYAIIQTTHWSPSGTQTLTLYANDGTNLYWTQSTAVGAGTQTSQQWIYMFSPGDIITMANTGSGLIMYGTIIVWPTATSIVKPLVARSLTSASQVVYTVPTGKNVIPVGSWPTLNAENGNGRCGNSSGTNSVFTINITIGGFDYLIWSASLTSPSSGGPTNWGGPIKDGNSIKIDITTAGARAVTTHWWLVVFEFNATDFPVTDVQPS